MRHLLWRRSSRSDRSALETFTCTESFKRLGRRHYPRPWERKVEAAVRTTNPACGSGQAIHLGFDGEGLAAVASVGKYGSQANYFLIETVAIATRCRQLGGQFADEAIEECLQWALNLVDAAGLTSVVLFAELDKRNNASRHMLARNRFVLGETREDSEMWLFESAAIPLFDEPRADA